MTLELQKFITKVVTVEALQLSSDNMAEAAALTGAWEHFDYINGRSRPYLKLRTARQAVVRCDIGMWIVRLPGGHFVCMTDKNFKAKYDLANGKSERVPPYSERTEDDDLSWFGFALKESFSPPYDR